MSHHRYDSWVHGVQAQVQQYDAALDPDLAEVRVRRNSWGTTIVKARNDGQVKGVWCHLAIPTPTILDDGSVRMDRFYLTGRVNGQATIQKVHIYQGGAPDHENIVRMDDLSLSARDLDEEFVVPGAYERDPPGRAWVKRIEKPCVICLYIELEDGGEAVIGGAAGTLWRTG